MYLFDKLTGKDLIGDIRIGLGRDVHRSVFENSDVGTEVTDESCGKFPFFGYTRGQFPGIVLYVLMSILADHE